MCVMAHLEEVLLRSGKEEEEDTGGMVDLLPDWIVAFMLAIVAGLTRLVIAPITEVMVGAFIMVIGTEYMFVILVSSGGVTPLVWLGYMVASFMIGVMLLIQGMERCT